MKVTAFNGSPRKDGNTNLLISQVLKELEKEGIETETVQLAGTELSGCTACYKCFDKKNKRCAIKKDALNDFIEKIIESDGILLGSPVYFANVTSEMKALIDRAGLVAKANDELFRHKVGAGVVAVRRAGSLPVFDALNHFFLIGQMFVPGSCYWNTAFGLDKGEVEGDEEGQRTMKVLGENMAMLLKKLKS